MKHKTLYTVLAFLITGNIVSAQFLSVDGIFQPTGLSNQGQVAGYAAQAGPYSIWNPDSGSISDIGGIAPGNGVGGQARFSTDGNFICGTSMGVNGPEMSRYSHSTGQWAPVGSLGFAVDGNVSGGYGISGDGNTVVGNSWADTAGNHAFTHCVAWNQTEGLMDLGSIFNDSAKSARANAVSGDGKVVVGWQDFNGPWKSAIWLKNPAGGYFPNHYLLIDTAGSASDEYNQLGECSCVSTDGKWIGGYGDYANNNQPWIWSKDSGVINLGALPNMGNGYISGISADGSVAVGWFDGMFFGDPHLPFIWTRSSGLHELNFYVTTILGLSTNTKVLYEADCISPNAQYIAGYGVDTTSFNSFAYRVSLFPSTGIAPVSNNSQVKIYPNPTSGSVTIENTGKAVLALTNMEGRLMDKIEISGTQVLDVSKYPAGVYSLTLQTGERMETKKVVKD